jgi:TRAP-type uncharacterized transport system substrate-binding protein
VKSARAGTSCYALAIGVAKVHPGALRYYKEIGVEMPAQMR